MSEKTKTATITNHLTLNQLDAIGEVWGESRISVSRRLIDRAFHDMVASGQIVIDRETGQYKPFDPAQGLVDPSREPSGDSDDHSDPGAGDDRKVITGQEKIEEIRDKVNAVFEDVKSGAGQGPIRTKGF